jgi:hypothetical protein
VVELRRCPPFDFYGEENPDDLDLVAAGDGVYLSLVISNSDGYAPGGDSLVTFNQQHHELRVNRFGDGGQEQYTSTASHDPDGNWFLNFIPGMGEMVGEDPLDGAPFTISGNTISGGLHLIQDWPEGETGEIDVTFNLEVPSSIGEC